MESLEDEIRNSLLDEGKNELISGEFKISIKGDNQIEIIELPPMNFRQLELPLEARHTDHFKGS